MTQVCRDCGRSFDADAAWKTRCLNCFIRMKREEERREHGTWQDDARRQRERDPAESYVRQAHRLAQDAFAAGRRYADDAASARYDAGYAEGVRDGKRQAPGPMDVDLLRAAIALCHPDRHPVERAGAANDVTARLLELLNATARRAA